MNTEYKSQGYLLDDFRLFHLNNAPGTRVDCHYHEFCKLLLLRSGSGGYMVEGRRYSLEAGDVVLIGSRCVHRPEFTDACERVIIYISPEFLRRSSGGGCDLEAVFSGAGGHVLRPGEKARRQLFGLADRLEGELSREDYGHVILGSVLLLQLLVEVGRVQRSAAALPGPIQPGNSRIQDILRYLDANLTEDITIDQLSEAFYISKYHMMRLFRRETGQSIHSYLSDRRLLHAKDLIAGGMSATESCFRSGFRSYSAFTRAYAKRFGSTPTGRNYAQEDLLE